MLLYNNKISATNFSLALGPLCSLPQLLFPTPSPSFHRYLFCCDFYSKQSSLIFLKAKMKKGYHSFTYRNIFKYFCVLIKHQEPYHPPSPILASIQVTVPSFLVTKTN